MQHLSCLKRKIAESVMSANTYPVGWIKWKNKGEMSVGWYLRQELDVYPVGWIKWQNKEGEMSAGWYLRQELWHHQYGHLSYKGLHTLCNKEMVVGLPEIEDVKTICEACVKGKHHRVPFPKQSKWRATERLQLIHSNLCGPINPPSNSQIIGSILLRIFSNKL